MVVFLLWIWGLEVRMVSLVMSIGGGVPLRILVLVVVRVVQMGLGVFEFGQGLSV